MFRCNGGMSKRDNAVVQTDILDDKGAAAYLGVEERTIRLWRRTRGLPHIKLTAKVVRIRRADLEKWIGSHLVKTAA